MAEPTPSVTPSAGPARKHARADAADTSAGRDRRVALFPSRKETILIRVHVPYESPFPYGEPLSLRLESHAVLSHRPEN